MKVLMINGSPREGSNSGVALDEMKKVFAGQGIECEEIQVGKMDIRGCVDCRQCGKLGKCAFDDIVNETAPKFEEADALVVASPVYFAGANATLKAFLQRLFFSTPFDKRLKVGASVVIARRGGCSTAFDELNKFFGIAGMPVVTSQYWNMVYGRNPGEAAEDGEGLQTVRTLANNMAFLMKCMKLGAEEYGLPEVEEEIVTNFIR